MKIPKHKVSRKPEFKEVIYSDREWKLLRKLRRKALEVMEVLVRCGLKPITHGSIARGDVDEGSDVDVVIPYVVQPFLITLCIENSGLNMFKKYIVKATPTSTPKAYIELDPEGKVTISFPITHLSTREWEFYRFGGLVTYDDLINNIRVPGVNKSLILIIPTDRGHKELPVIGYEDYVARVVGVSIETVQERIKVLTRRDEHGRTGVFLNYVLLGDESFEEAINKLIESGKLKL